MAGDALFDLRNRLLCNPRFRRIAEKIPLFRSVARSSARDLFALASGFIHSQVLVTCLELGLLERLRQGPRSVAAIARDCGLPERRARRLLAAAAALRLLERRRNGRYGLGMLGAAMVDNAPLLALVRHHAGLYRDLAEPVELFRDPQAGAHMRALWPYATSSEPQQLAAAEVESYTTLMAASQAMIAEQVLAAYSLRGHRRLLDVGGGAGAFVAAVHRRWPHLQLTLVDLPAVAEIARRRLGEAGLGDAVDVVAADAWRDPLPGPCDVVSLVRILHDHDDEALPPLLAAARQALAPDGVLLIAEPLAGPRGAGPLIDAYFNVYLLAMGSGRPRRFDELERLLQNAGFTGVRRHATRLPLITSVVTARPGKSV